MRICNTHYEHFPDEDSEMDESKFYYTTCGKTKKKYLSNHCQRCKARKDYIRKYGTVPEKNRRTGRTTTPMYNDGQDWSFLQRKWI